MALPSTGSQVSRLEILEKKTSSSGPDIKIRVKMARHSLLTTGISLPFSIVFKLRITNKGAAIIGRIIRRWKENISNPVNIIEQSTPVRCTSHSTMAAIANPCKEKTSLQSIVTQEVGVLTLRSTNKYIMYIASEAIKINIIICSFESFCNSSVVCVKAITPIIYEGHVDSTYRLSSEQW